MFKTQVGLGVLSLPSVLHTLGIVPGTITLLAVGALSTCESRFGLLVLHHEESLLTLRPAGFSSTKQGECMSPGNSSLGILKSVSTAKDPLQSTMMDCAEPIVE